jgi:hypothetical protein
LNEQEAAASEEEEGSEGSGAVGGFEAGETELSPSPTEAPLVATSAPAGALGDPEAKAKVASAAEAIGLTTEALVNLVADSGLLAMEPDDFITKTYTLRDLGYKLFVELSTVPEDGRAKWFKELAPQQQKAIVVTLRDRGFSSHNIGRSFNMKTVEINRWWNEYADDMGAQVVGTRLATIAGNLQLVAQRTQEMASDKANFAAMWRIQKEFTQLLQSMGIVDRAIHKVEHTLKVGDQQAEIDAMVDLEMKKKVRHEEMKRIEVEVIDDLPEDFGDEDNP